MINKPMVFLGFALVLSATSAFPDEDPIVSAMRKEFRVEPKNKACQLLAEASGAVKTDSKTLKAAVNQFAANLRYGDVPSLRARGDASRLGLYGFKVNQVEAMRFYEAAARQGSAEAAFNVALNTLHATQWRPSEQEAKKILSALMTDTGAHYNANGSLYSQIYYVVGQVHEHGWAGKVDMGNAFLAYRASTRNSYVPGIYRYLSLLASSFPKMDAHEKRATQQEVNVLTGRWKWSFPGIMRLTGDFHAMGALGDFEGFKAQYHWRLAEHLVQLKPAMYASEIELLKSRVVKLAPLQEKRLDDAIKAAIRNNQPKLDDHPLQFATLCT